MTKPLTRARRFAHRKAVARQLNSVYSHGGYTSAYIQTCLPIRALAMWGNTAFYGGRVVSRERHGTWSWKLADPEALIMLGGADSGNRGGGDSGNRR